MNINNTGSLRSLTLPNGFVSEYTYYKNNRLHTLVNRSASGQILEAYQYAYDGAGNMTAKQDARGLTAFAYTASGQLKTVSEPGGRVTSYTYDAAGNRATETVTQGGVSVTTTYEVNAQNRLVSVTVPDGPMTRITRYTYDAAGNMLSSLTETLAPAGVELPEVFLSRMSADVSLFSFNARNQMVRAEANGATVTNSFGPERLRTGKATEENTWQFKYEYDRIVLEKDSSGAMTLNIYGTRLLARKEGNTRVFYLYNGRGDVTALVNEQGQVIASYYYDPFGNILEEFGTHHNPFRFKKLNAKAAF